MPATFFADRPPLTVLIAAPRGFCAGVDRAIKIVELAIERFGPPVYVRHEIVHNRFVVDRLRGLGAVFVEELDEVPDGRPVVFSAHGVPKVVPAAAEARGLDFVDATCPLVSKVHRQAQRLIEAGRHILFIGHAGHPEVIGTFGQVPAGAMTLVETADQAGHVAVTDADNLAFLTQTTLSVDDTSEIIAVLTARFPAIRAPKGEDICYATTNRQMAIRQLAKESDLVLVVGSTTSSNSNRLREVAEQYGTESYLLSRIDEVRPEWRTDYKTVGISSGASTPEVMVENVIGALLDGRTNVPVDILETIKEDVVFKPNRELLELAQAK